LESFPWSNSRTFFQQTRTRNVKAIWGRPSIGSHHRPFFIICIRCFLFLFHICSFQPHFISSRVHINTSWILVVSSKGACRNYSLRLTTKARAYKGAGDALPTSFIDSNANLRWKQWKSKELGHVP
jgi:hypothetical protein